mmetsp:Transcript_4659/g.17546  ORF Transcript_4659/g.17546 Transcript_4659/m.17546 type:complete len:339 (+) Transcript_4659:828-1844(+)
MMDNKTSDKSDVVTALRIPQSPRLGRSTSSAELASRQSALRTRTASNAKVSSGKRSQKTQMTRLSASSLSSKAVPHSTSPLLEPICRRSDANAATRLAAVIAETCSAMSSMACPSMHCFCHAPEAAATKSPTSSRTMSSTSRPVFDRSASKLPADAAASATPAFNSSLLTSHCSSDSFCQMAKCDANCFTTNGHGEPLTPSPSQVRSIAITSSPRSGSQAEQMIVACRAAKDEATSFKSSLTRGTTILCTSRATTASKSVPLVPRKAPHSLSRRADRVSGVSEGSGQPQSPSPRKTSLGHHFARPSSRRDSTNHSFIQCNSAHKRSAQLPLHAGSRAS